MQLLEERARRRRIPAVWQQIRGNVLTHRRRKVQEEDDVMICNCKPVWRGGDGCGPECINRMLCVECDPVSAVAGTGFRQQGRKGTGTAPRRPPPALQALITQQLTLDAAASWA